MRVSNSGWGAYQLSAYQSLVAAYAATLVESSQAVKPVRATECPVFTPTEAEFRDPIAYLRNIAVVGRKYGIVKIVPPAGWLPGCGVSKDVASRPMATREQHVHKLQEAEEFDDGPEYTLSQYKCMADQFVADKFPHFLAPPDTAVKASPPVPEPAAAALSSSSASPLPPSSSASAVSESGLASMSRDGRMPFGATRDLGPLSHCLSLAQQVEDTYWRIVETQCQQLTVHYANDLDVRINGSGFVPPRPTDTGVGEPEAVPVDLKSRSYYRLCGWNLRNMPRAAGSLLRYMKEDIAGINVPWLYVGMLFASFAWHTEDNYLYSVNYMHYGTAKTWYGVPSRHASRFDNTVKKHRFERFDEEPDLIHKLTTIISPSTIQAADIPVFHTVQEPGEFVITFPRAYHCGFSHGFNIAEACNFALPDWVPMGRMALLHYEQVARDTCFSHEEVIINAARDAGRHDAATCTLLAKELRTITQRERQDRQHFLSLRGVSPSHVHTLDGTQQRYNCAVSRRMCYVSAVVCQSAKCRAEAEDARAEALVECRTERARLRKLGIDPSSVVEPDPQHNVVMPRFADSLCDCSYDNLRMVTWFDCDELAELASALEARASVLTGAHTANPRGRGAEPAATTAHTPERPTAIAHDSIRFPSLAHPPAGSAVLHHGVTACSTGAAVVAPSFASSSIIATTSASTASSASSSPACSSSAAATSRDMAILAAVMPSITPTRSHSGSPSDNGSAMTAVTNSPRAIPLPTKL